MVKGDFMAVFADFHTQRKFVKSINSTFISLIPKIHRAKDIKDFQIFALLALWEVSIRL